MDEINLNGISEEEAIAIGFVDIDEYKEKLKSIRDYVIYTHIVSESNTILDSIGRAYQLHTWTNRAIRTSIANELLDNTLATVDEYGHDLVYSSYLTDSSDLCLNYQNEIFSRTGLDKKYPPLDPALWRNGGGLIHINCRHRISVYIKGLSELEKEIPLADVKKNQKAREEYLRIRNQKNKWVKKQKELNELGIKNKKVDAKAREWRNRLNKFQPKPDDKAFII